MPGGIRRFHKGGKDKLRDPKGRHRWGTDTSAAVIPTSDTDKWSLIHMSIGGGVPISGTVAEEDDQEMMIGLITSFDYS